MTDWEENQERNNAKGRDYAKHPVLILFHF